MKLSIQSIQRQFFETCQNKFLKTTFWTLLTQVLFMAMQFFYFIIIAKALTAEDYGLFVGIASLASLLISFASWGSGDVLVKYVSRKRELFPEYWGNALLTTSVVSTVVIAFCLIIAKQFLPSSTSTLSICLILFADIFCLSLFNVAGAALTSVDKLYKVAGSDIVYICNKLVAAGLFFLGGWGSDFVTWAWLYSASVTCTAIISNIVVAHSMGMPKFRPRLILRHFKEGFHFSLSYSSDKVNNDIDKTMLASSAPLAAGVYAAGSRFLFVAFTPLKVLFQNAYMRFFKHGETGIQGSFGFAKRLLPVVLVYGCLTTAGFVFGAPLLPSLLGESYADTVTVLHWLAPYVLIVGLQSIAADSLTGAGFQSWRGAMNVGAALLNVGLNFWLIPRYSWMGAVWATLASDGLKLIVLWFAVVSLLFKTNNRNATI